MHKIRAIISERKLLVFDYADPLVRSSVVPYVEGHLQERQATSLAGEHKKDMLTAPFEFDALEALLSQVRSVCTYVFQYIS